MFGGPASGFSPAMAALVGGGQGSTGSAPLPNAPQTPNAPPLFGEQQAQTPQNQRKGGYSTTVLGGGNPSNTGQKTLLGA